MEKIVAGQIVAFGEHAGDVLHFDRGAIVIDAKGRISWLGNLRELPEAYSKLVVEDFGDKMILAGFVDAHIHFPQYRMLAAPAADLLDWLARYTFPEEARYGDPEHAAGAADIFLNRLFTHGTTSAMVFCSVHRTCADALFAAAQKCNMALVTGKTMMDRNAIPAVHDTPVKSAQDSESLYLQWHGKARLRYAVTPRFAITSSDAQLALAGELLKSLPDAMLQSHISESAAEIAFTRDLFPSAKDYTDVYDQFGLLGPRSVFAHGIHLGERERARFSETGSSVIHCPTSNNFLGSGLMSMKRLSGVALGVGTDVGGGTSFSMLQTLAETFKVQMLTGTRLSAFELLHMATAQNAKRIGIDADTGRIAVGQMADIVVLDPKATAVLAARQEVSTSLEDVLFSLIMLGDDRAVFATYVAGRKISDLPPMSV
jgi:guanine deaminase